MKINLFLLIERGDFSQYRINISKADINSRDIDGVSFLQTAIASKQIEIALDLLERKIDINSQDKKGMSSLHYLGWYPNIILAEKIIQLGGNVHLKDKYGNTPLWYAVFFAKGEYSYVKLLLQNGANPLSFNNAGKTPVMCAQTRSDPELISLMQLLTHHS